MSDITQDRSFGGWLRKFRLEKEITLRKAAITLGMDSGNYCKIENSRMNPPTLKGVRKLAKGLGLSDVQTSLLESLAFTHHMALFKRKWEQS